MNSKTYVEKLLAPAGIQINGDRAWDIQVYNDRFYKRVIRHGSLGLGEAYIEGWWDAKELDSFFYNILNADLGNSFAYTPSTILLYLQSLFTNRQSKSRAYEIGRRHYDIGNDLYRVMLDKRMVYTCAYWQDAENLDQAQEAKLDLVCRKIGLKTGQRVLDVGCGWGSFAQYAAEFYDANVVGITVSENQVALGRELCKGYPVEIRLQDYRDVDEKFDHIVSLGMIEHVGSKNYRNYIRKIRSCLNDDGIFLLQTIGSGTSVRSSDPWINKYIFPNSMIPSIAQLGSALEGLMVMEDWQNFGPDYDKTLMAWFNNFHKGWNSLKANYPDYFYRMWKYYLLLSAASFWSRKNQLWQIVLSNKGIPNGYQPLRYSQADILQTFK